MIAQMHKAISIIQFKLEAEIIQRRPDFEMEDRMNVICEKLGEADPDEIKEKE